MLDSCNTCLQAGGEGLVTGSACDAACQDDAGCMTQAGRRRWLTGGFVHASGVLQVCIAPLNLCFSIKINTTEDCISCNQMSLRKMPADRKY